MEAPMKRPLAILASTICLSTVMITIGVDMSASAFPVSKHVAALPHAVNNGVIAKGATWTLYDEDTFDGNGTCGIGSQNQYGNCTSSNSGDAICEELTFEAGGTFKGDLGDYGTDNGRITLTFAIPASASVSNRVGVWGWYAWQSNTPVAFSGTYDASSRFFTGSVSWKKAGYVHVVGAALLQPGKDPLGYGDC
jgi:hypothetical protein